MKTSIDKMVEWLEIELKKAEQYCDVNIGAFIPHPFRTVLDKARQLQSEEQAQKPTESLAELADRKQGWKISYQRCFRERPPDVMGIDIVIGGPKWNDSMDIKRFVGKTYAEAESKARAYLESLPAKMEEGK